jgi:hypothetical protein
MRLWVRENPMIPVNNGESPGFLWRQSKLLKLSNYCEVPALSGVFDALALSSVSLVAPAL